MASGEEQAALLKALERVGSQAGMTAKDIKRIGDSAPQAASKVAEAFAKINVDVDAVNRGISKGAKEAFMDFSRASTLAAESAQNSSKLIRASFDEIAGGLKSKEEFAAFNATLRETGDLGKLGGERMQILRAGMQGGAEAANAMRSALEQHGQATQALADASGKVKEAKEAETQAVRDNAVAHKDASEAEAAGAEKSAEATEKKKKAMMTIYDASKLNAEAIGLVDDAINSMVTSMGHMDADDYLRKVEAMARVGQQYVADVQRAEAATERLNQRTSDGTVSMHDIAEATHAATSNITALDSTTLKNLNASIDAAKKKLEDLQQQAKDTAADLDAELAQLKGDDSKTAKLEQQRKLRELEGKLQEARIRGNAEEIAQYERALELQRQIGAEKARQAADKKAEAAARAGIAQPR